MIGLLRRFRRTRQPWHDSAGRFNGRLERIKRFNWQDGEGHVSLDLLGTQKGRLTYEVGFPQAGYCGSVLDAFFIRKVHTQFLAHFHLTRGHSLDGKHDQSPLRELMDGEAP